MQIGGFVTGYGQEVHTTVLIGNYVYRVGDTFQHFTGVVARGLIQHQSKTAFLCAFELYQEGSIVIDTNTRTIIILRSGLVGDDDGASLYECLFQFESYVPSVSDLHLDTPIQNSSCNFERG